MLTRGYIIGKIVDDLAGLKYQVETRNGLHLYDLTKFCEDFFKDLLNIVYNLNLVNLNQERSNSPGLDLGDIRKKKAFQITSTKTSQKASDTLAAITSEHKLNYEDFKIFIVGKKQQSYTIEQTLLESLNFDWKRDILDIDDVLRDIVVLETDTLNEIFNLFKSEFRRLRIELEPVDQTGDFESSLYHNIEKIPNKKPINASKLADLFDGDEFTYDSLINVYDRLAATPRLPREIVSIIAERGSFRSFNHSSKEWGILPQKLKQIVRMSDSELHSELTILLDEKLIYWGEDDVDDELTRFVTLNWSTLNGIVSWAKNNQYSLRRLFNTMDWTMMDEE